MLEIRIDGTAFGPADEADVRRYFAEVLANVRCPVHDLQLEAVSLLGQSPDALELELVACCGSLRAAAKRALGLGGGDGKAESDSIPESSAELLEVVPTAEGQPAAQSATRKSARISAAWEIATVGPTATAIAELFARRSVNGKPHDPQLHISTIREATGASDDDLIVAVRELEGLGWVIPRHVPGAVPFGYNMVVPTARLFERVDRRVKGWDPTRDAMQVASELVRAERRRIETNELAERLGWEPRRLNPALSYLIMHDGASPSGNADRLFIAAYISSNAHTRRFCA